MKYVCLLRGVNAGGANRVEMLRFRQVLERLGYSSVSTYINSGNAIFQSDSQPDVIKVHEALVHEFGINIPVLIINEDQLRGINKAIPANWQNNYTDQKSDVAFLFPEVDSQDILGKVSYRPEFETIIYTPGALLSNISRQNQPKSSLFKLIGTPLYQQITVRNITTVRKLAELLNK